LDNFHLNDCEIPFVRIQPHPWRRLKTKGSARDVPLAGSSLWAVQRILKSVDHSDFAFQRYNLTETTNANSASAALNKWLKGIVPEKPIMHGFRHSMRDRLRNVECPTEIADQIGGWSSSSNIGQSYGSGYSLEKTHKWLAMAVDPYDPPSNA
jgi:integrase